MKSLEDLKKLREEALQQVKLRKSKNGARIVVGMATCGISAGARQVLMTIMDEVAKRALEDVQVTQTGCIGVCRLEPIVEVYIGDEKVTYVDVDADKAKKIVAEHIVNGRVVTEYTIGAYEK